MKRNKTPVDWKKLMEPFKKYQYALLILLVGLVLLVWPAGTGGGTQQDAEVSGGTTGEVEESQYLNDLETRLAKSLSKIDGVGEAEVVLTLRAGSETILAADQTVDSDSEKMETVVISSGSGQQTTVTTQVLYPTFQGALVVCDGGNSATVRLNVLKAVEALTGLKADNITVCATTGGKES